MGQSERALAVVEAVGALHFEGNLLPHQWFQHVRYPDGKPNTVAMIVLSEIVYWYRPRIEKDEQTGQVIGVYTRFKGDKLQRSHGSFVTQFGFTKAQVRLALTYLEDELGVITTELRDLHTSMGQRLTNVMFIEIVPERLRSITVVPMGAASAQRHLPAAVQATTPAHPPLHTSDLSSTPSDLSSTPSDLSSIPPDLSSIPPDLSSTATDLQRRPSDLQRGTYTETTTQTTTRRTVRDRATPAPNVVVALTALGLSERQARSAQRQHQWTDAEVAAWADYLATIDSSRANPIAVLMTLLRTQRLPPPRRGEPAPHAAVVPLPPSPHHTLWQAVQARLQELLDPTLYNTWLRDTRLLAGHADRSRGRDRQHFRSREVRRGRNAHADCHRPGRNLGLCGDGDAGDWLMGRADPAAACGRYPAQRRRSSIRDPAH